MLPFKKHLIRGLFLIFENFELIESTKFDIPTFRNRKVDCAIHKIKALNSFIIPTDCEIIAKVVF